MPTSPDPARPFGALRPAAGTGHVEWALTQMRDRSGIDEVVPSSYEARVKVLHPATAEDGDPAAWQHIVPGWRELDEETFVRRYHDAVMNDSDGRLPSVLEGHLAQRLVMRLAPLLRAATTTPDDCHYGVWEGLAGLGGGAVVGIAVAEDEGWSAAQLRAEQRRMQAQLDAQQRKVDEFVRSCPLCSWWGGRDMRLLDGTVDDVHGLADLPWVPETDGDPEVEVQLYGPQWWWPADRAWFVGCEIDYAWSYLCGTQPLIDEVLRLDADGVLEAVQVPAAGG